MRRPHLAIAVFACRFLYTFCRGLRQAASCHHDFTTTLCALSQPVFLMRTGIALRDNTNLRTTIYANNQQIITIPLHVLGLPAVKRQASCHAHQGIAFARVPASRNHNHRFHVPINLIKCRPAPDTVGYYKKESVESFVYLDGGSDKTLSQINNTPHLYCME